MNNDKYELIDAPVGPYSSIEDISAWIKGLESREQNEQVLDEIEQAKRWLKRAEND